MKTSCRLTDLAGRDTFTHHTASAVLSLIFTAIFLGAIPPLLAQADPVPPPLETVTHPPVAVVTVKAVDPYASEPGVTTVIDDGMFVISRSYYTNIDMRVYFRLGGTASNGIDYELPLATPNSVVIPKGRWAVQVPVRVKGDLVPEGVETVILRLEPIACIAIYPPPPECYQVGQPAEAVVYIRDSLHQERPPYVAIKEPKDGALFPYPTEVPISARTVDPDGYCWQAEFFAGTKSIGTSVVAFVVAPTNGTPVDFDFTWNNPPPGRHVLTVRATGSRGDTGVSAPVHIAVGQPITNRPPEVSVVAVDPLAVEGTNCWGWYTFTNRYADGVVQYTNVIAGSGETIWWYTNCGPKSATFVIRRAGPTNEPLQVFFNMRGVATNGVDYELIPSSVVIPAGSRRAEVLVVPKDDPVIEPPESVILELAPPPYANILPPPYAIVRPVRAGAVIVDSARPPMRPRLLPGHFFYLGATVPDGSWWRVERSKNLVDWETVCTNQVIQGQLHYVDPDAETEAMFFYRTLPAAPMQEE
jgi:hypothetical protein